MDSTEESLRELLNKLDLQPLKNTHGQWTYQSTQDINGSLPTVTITDGATVGGTLHPTYGAVPNVTVGSGIASSTFSPTSVWTSGGTTTAGTPVWTTTGTGYTIGTPTTTQINQGGKIHIQGDNADLVIGDKSMRTWMEKVEERLNILTPNPEMEKEWDDLRKLGERYRKLEKKCKEKSEVWKRLKAT